MVAACRLCGSSDIEVFVDFGSLAMTGFFPKENESVSVAPLAMGKCQACGLVQLRDKLPISELYGPGYGYESHLNSSMQAHLKEVAQKLELRLSLRSGDVVVDIASNDGTLLSGYANLGLQLIGIDPLIPFLTDNYPSHAIKIDKFFSKEAYCSVTKKKAKLITSFSVFYDLDDPIRFADDIFSILADDGLWVLEQSYLPTMVRSLGFDTICHEHLLYLSLNDIQKICNQVGLEIVDFTLNDINGGSIQILIQKNRGPKSPSPYISPFLKFESESRLISNEGLIDFGKQIEVYKNNLLEITKAFKDRGYEIQGLGASTKGNVLLQVCELDKQTISAIGEVNPRKFGRFTPGSAIPIVDENEIFEGVSRDRLILVRPWHFKDSILEKAKLRRLDNVFLLFPLPFEPSVFDISSQGL